MSVYRLNVIYSGREAHTDIEGAEFPDDLAAITEARRGLRELVSFAIQTACEAPTAIQVTDDKGAEIALISRRDLIPAVWFSVQ
jgi:hypothetical protein